MLIISLLLLNMQTSSIKLGDKLWCSVFPDRPCYFCVPESNTSSTYCVWDSKEECEKNKQYENERCEENKNETAGK